MDIACPNCAATYRVPDSLLARRMALRCAACDHEWVPEAPRDVAEGPATPEPAPLAESGVPLAAAPEPAPRETPPMVSPPTVPLAPAAQALTPQALTSQAPGPRPERPSPPTTPPPLQRRAGPGPMGVKRRRGRARPLALPIAWAASITLVVAGLAGLVVFRAEIALAWPPFARVASLLSG